MTIKKQPGFFNRCVEIEHDNFKIKLFFNFQLLYPSVSKIIRIFYNRKTKAATHKMRRLSALKLPIYMPPVSMGPS